MLKKTRMKGFGQLLIAMVVYTLVQPFVEDFRILSIVAVIVLLDGLYITVPPELRAGFRNSLIALWVLLSGVVAVSFFVRGTMVNFAATLTLATLQAALMAICLATTLRHVLLERRVTIEMIAGAMVGYFFIVYLFTNLYRIVALLSPDAFQMQPWNVDAGPLKPRTELIYFSFVTAATLGYGDILPRNGFAQMLSVLEAVIGQFYLATVIARLVSLYREEPLQRDVET